MAYDGYTGEAIGEKLDINPTTVSKWFNLATIRQRKRNGANFETVLDEITEVHAQRKRDKATSSPKEKVSSFVLSDWFKAVDAKFDEINGKLDRMLEFTGKF